MHETIMEHKIYAQNIIDHLEKNINSLETTNKSIDTLSFLRDSAWNLFEYDKYAAIELFVNTAATYDDYLSYYSLGNIYENYLYQPQLGVEYFLKAFDLVDDESFKSVLKNKLLLIQESIKDKVDSLIQKEYYKIGYNFLIEKSNLDSAQKYFDNSKKIKYSSQLNQVINDYKNTLNIINYKEIKDSLNTINWSSEEFQRNEIDSIIMNLSEISFWYFKDIKTSESYLELIQINDSIKYYDKYIDLKKRIASKDFERDTSITKFNPHIQKSQKFSEYYTKISQMDNIYKDDLSKYNNLLNYLTENLQYKEDIDSLKLESENQPNMENIKNSLPIMKDVQMGIPINIDININDDKSN